MHKRLSDRVDFADREDNETVELFLRQHWVTNLPWIYTAIALMLVPLFLPALLIYFGMSWVREIPTDVTISLSVVWGMLIVAFVTESFLHWYFNIYIVTNHHLVDINFHNILYRDKTEIRLEDIQSSKPSIKGFTRSLFNFGDIIIETAAERQRIEFKAVPRPDLVAEVIQDLQRAFETPLPKGDSHAT